MRALIIILSVLVIVISARSADAGLSTTQRETSAPVDTATITDEANRQAEDQIGLSKTKRREVQRRLTRLGFETKIDGTFDDSTRDSIARWQDEHAYPKTGFLTNTQHQALLRESASMDASKADRRHGGGRARHSRGIGGPFGVIGGLVGGLFRH
jgi:hypothetical protein